MPDPLHKHSFAEQFEIILMDKISILTSGTYLFTQEDR